MRVTWSCCFTLFLFAGAPLASAQQVEGWVSDSSTRRWSYQPLPELDVAAGSAAGATWSTTDLDGRVRGVDGAGGLPWGLSGPYERVLPLSAEPYPAVGEDLRVGGPDRPATSEDANVFFHLVGMRRFLASLPGVPQTATHQPVLAIPRAVVAVNAMACSWAQRAEGRTFQAAIVFGHDLGRSPAVVAHERAHVFLSALGFRATGTKWSDSVHEGLADYFAAAYVGSPDLGVRDLGSLRIYPDDWTAFDAHEAGLVLASALWAARCEAAGLGLAVSGLDGAVARAVAAFPAGVGVEDAAEAILAVADPQLAALLRPSFLARGLIDDEASGHAAKLDLRVGAGDPDSESAPWHQWPELSSAWVVPVGAPSGVFVTALTGADRGLDTSTLTIEVEGPDFLRTRAGVTRSLLAPDFQPVPGRSLWLHVTPRASQVGSYRVRVSVRTAKGGDVAARTIRLHVVPPDWPTSLGTGPILTLPEGGDLTVSPEVIFPALRGISTPYRVLVVGDTGLSTESDGSTVHVAAPEGAVGLHLLTLAIEAVGTGCWALPPRSAQLVVRVGSGPSLEVFRGTVNPVKAWSYEVAVAQGQLAPGVVALDLVPPGRGLTLVDEATPDDSSSSLQLYLAVEDPPVGAVWSLLPDTSADPLEPQTFARYPTHEVRLQDDSTQAASVRTEYRLASGGRLTPQALALGVLQIRATRITSPTLGEVTVQLAAKGQVPVRRTIRFWLLPGHGSPGVARSAGIVGGLRGQ